MSFTINVQLDKNNPDYEMELFWYGFKNLINNYYFNLKDDQNQLYTDSIKILSNELNNLQILKNYDIIYDEIYKYFKKFIISIIKIYVNYNDKNNSYLFSWIKRYNKIPGSIKIETGCTNKNVSEISEMDIIILKLKIMENKYDSELIKLLDENIFEFLYETIDDELYNLYDYVGERYNMNEFYIKYNIKVKGKMKGKKINKLME